MRSIVTFLIAISLVMGLGAENVVQDIDCRLRLIDSVASRQLALAEQQGLLIDPPFELMSYFQVLENLSPDLLDSIPSYAEPIADYCSDNRNSPSVTLLSFQSPSQYVKTLCHLIEKQELEGKELKQFLMEASCPCNNKKLLLDRHDNRVLLRQQFQALLDTLRLQSLIDKETYITLLNDMNNGDIGNSYTQEELIHLSAGDTIILSAQHSEDAYHHYDLLHNGARYMYDIKCLDSGNNLIVSVEAPEFISNANCYLPNGCYTCFDIEDNKLTEALIQIIHNECLGRTENENTLNIEFKIAKSINIETVTQMLQANGFVIGSVNHRIHLTDIISTIKRDNIHAMPSHYVHIIQSEVEQIDL